MQLMHWRGWCGWWFGGRVREGCQVTHSESERRKQKSWTFLEHQRNKIYDKLMSGVLHSRWRGYWSCKSLQPIIGSMLEENGGCRKELAKRLALPALYQRFQWQQQHFRGPALLGPGLQLFNHCHQAYTDFWTYSCMLFLQLSVVSVNNFALHSICWDNINWLN